MDEIFDNNEERENELNSLKDRIGKLVQFDENNEALQHLTGERLEIVIKKQQEIQEKTKILQEMMQTYLSSLDEKDEL